MLKFGLVCILGIFLCSSWLNLICILIILSLGWFVSLQSYNMGGISFVVRDNLRFFLALLSLWVTFLIFMIRFYLKFAFKNYELFTLLCVSILVFLLFSFSTNNLLMFYILFEASLIPIFLLVIGWGYQPERVGASYYLLFYTLTASLPLLLGIFTVSLNLGTLDFVLFCENFIITGVIFTSITLAFLVKMPVYFVHLWLPKAHVEAPVAGSMILAGVLLKLGGYGLLRTSLFIERSFKIYSSWFVALSLVGGVAASLICIRQTDCKSLVAYSSVAHIALVLLGVFLTNNVGVAGAIIIIIAHGLCSSGLFALVGISYERSSTRRLILLRRSMRVAPVLALWWFLFRISNIAAPPTTNLAGEVLIFISSLSWLTGVALVVGLISFLGAVYNLFLFSSTQHGREALLISGVEDAKNRENIALLLHIGPLLLSLCLLINLFT